MEREVNRLIASLLVLGLVPGTALANSTEGSPYEGYGQFRYAQVIDVVPLVRIDEVDVPTRVCDQGARVVDQAADDRFGGDYAHPYDPVTAPRGDAGELASKLVAREAAPQRSYPRDVSFRRADDRGGSRDERLRSDRRIDPDRRYEGGPGGDRYSDSGARVQVLPRVETTVTCRLEHDVEQRQTVDGYRVTYEYRGQRYVTETTSATKRS